MNRRIALAAAAVLAAGAPVVRAEWAYLNRKLKAGHSPIGRVLVLPARIDIKRTSFHGTEAVTEASEQIAAAVYNAVVDELKTRGVEVVPGPRPEDVTAKLRGLECRRFVCRGWNERR